jgi:uncharacterized phage protein (TIGR02218 family)
MRHLPNGLSAHLASGATTICHCWRIKRSDGVALGFTDHDRALLFDGTVFEAASGFTASSVETQLGLAVGGVEVSGALASSSLGELEMANGLYDNARVEIYEVNWADTSERVLMDIAVIGEIRRSETEFTAELRSLAHALDQDRGRIYQSGCSAALGDNRCRANIDDEPFTAVVSVSGLTSDGMIQVDTIQFESGWFSGGRGEVISGENTGATFATKQFVRQSDTSLLQLWMPLASPFLTGDLLRLVAGCDKRFETCRDKFSNIINFRGFPHIPGNDALLTHPGTSDGTMDGGSLFNTNNA